MAEQTLILLKPDAVRRGLVGAILARIENKGYALKALRLFEATREELDKHYHEHVDKPFYPGVVRYMTSGPMVAAIFEGNRVIEGVRVLAGSTDPTTAPAGTIRGDYGFEADGDAIQNLIHASDSPESAATEIAVWFA